MGDQIRAHAPALEAPLGAGMPHRREGIMAPTRPAVRVRITVIRTPQVGFAGANRIHLAEPMSNRVCGPDRRGTNHGNDSNIIADDVQGAAQAAGTEMERAADNIHNGARRPRDAGVAS